MSRKQFGANGVGLRVKRRLDVLYVQHLVDQTIKLALTFPQNFEEVVNLSSVVAMLYSKVFPNGCVDISVGSVPDIICLAQITLK